MILIASSLLSQIALVVAIALFVGIILWLWLTPRSRWKRSARLPLDDGEPESPDARDRADRRRDRRDPSNDRSEDRTP